MLNIQKTVFSSRGSYLGILEEPAYNGGGLWIRTLINSVWGTMNVKKTASQILRILPVREHRFLSYQVSFVPWCLTLSDTEGSSQIWMSDCCSISFLLDNMDIILEHDFEEVFASNIVCEKNKLTAIYPLIKTQISICLKDGEIEYNNIVKRILIKGCKEFVIRVQRSDLYYPAERYLSVDDVKLEYEKFREKTISGTPLIQEETSCYLLWSGTFMPLGLIRKEYSVISKYRMNMVFGWASAFIGLALAKIDPQLARNNYLQFTQCQNENGLTIDAINPVLSINWYTKPPVHGYLYRKYTEAGIEFSNEEKRIILSSMKRLVIGWKGISSTKELACYTFAWDSGMDNSTCFDDYLPLSTPDLNTFLIFLLDCIVKLCNDLGLEDEAAMAETEMHQYLTRFLTVCWNGEEFLALRSNGIPQKVETPIRYFPLLLGELLPKRVRDCMLESLDQSGILCRWSVASESLLSIKFNTRQGDTRKPGSYWRGPVWPYFVEILVDALETNGVSKKAELLRKQFIEAVENNPEGIYENYDALSGIGNDDSCDVWTAAVYLMEKNYSRTKKE